MRRNYGELVFMGGNGPAGFGGDGWYGWILPEGPPDDHIPCFCCDDPECLEWCDVLCVAGESRAEALTNILAGRFSHYAYHVGECRMATDRPMEWEPGWARHQPHPRESLTGDFSPPVLQFRPDEVI